MVCVNYGCTLRVLVVLDAEDVLVESLESWADGVHRVGIGAEMYEWGVIREGKHRSSGVESYILSPA